VIEAQHFCPNPSWPPSSIKLLLAEDKCPIDLISLSSNDGVVRPGRGRQNTPRTILSMKLYTSRQYGLEYGGYPEEPQPLYNEILHENDKV
jgi:hypothetical protein